MGVSNADALSFGEASDLIDAGGFPSEKSGRWYTERLFLYPQLYPVELEEYLSEQLHMLEEKLSENLHAYVRGRLVGSSERLTRSKILDVIRALTKEDERWWQQSKHEAVFLERLKQMYPGCCDGHAPASREFYSQHENHPAKGVGCLVILGACLLPIAVVAMAGMLHGRGHAQDKPQTSSRNYYTHNTQTP